MGVNRRTTAALERDSGKIGPAWPPGCRPALFQPGADQLEQPAAGRLPFAGRAGWFDLVAARIRSRGEPPLHGGGRLHRGDRSPLWPVARHAQKVNTGYTGDRDSRSQSMAGLRGYGGGCHENRTRRLSRLGQEHAVRVAHGREAGLRGRAERAERDGAGAGGRRRAAVPDLSSQEGHAGLAGARRYAGPGPHARRQRRAAGG